MQWDSSKFLNFVGFTLILAFRNVIIELSTDLAAVPLSVNLMKTLMF